MASKYQREHDMYVARGNTDRAAQVVAAAKAEGDPVAEPAKADKPARKRAEAEKVQAELDRLAGPVVPPAPVSVTDDPETAANGSGSAAPAKAKRARKR